MSKEISQVFTKNFGHNKKGMLHITARNGGRHLICFNGQDDFLCTTEDMRILATHLTETADTIDKDNDFTPQKS